MFSYNWFIFITDIIEYHLRYDIVAWVIESDSKT